MAKPTALCLHPGGALCIMREKAMPDDTDRAFLARSRHYLRHDYPVKIDRCLGRLSADDLWWRPNEASNSIGNLILHLAGNVRQWLVHGVGGAADVRQRQHEFDARDPLPAEELRRHLHTALDAADVVLERLDPAALAETRHIQGLDVTVLDAVYHVVEHFAMHTGQILYVTKLRRGEDLGFYKIEDGKVRGGW